mmetsp:Transcript_42219/g.116720  ORF Transcript_42219/g.116720 Transcript_42219/m.116720 type:complete len:261 (+) Transcript_42219:633-1415(+)
MPTSPNMTCSLVRVTTTMSAKAPATTRQSATAPVASRTVPCSEGWMTPSRLAAKKPHAKVASMAGVEASASTSSMSAVSSGTATVTASAQSRSVPLETALEAAVRFATRAARSTSMGSCCGCDGGMPNVPDALTPESCATRALDSSAACLSADTLNGGPLAKPDASMAASAWVAMSVRLNVRLGAIVVQSETAGEAKQPATRAHGETDVPPPKEIVCWSQTPCPRVVYGSRGISSTRWPASLMKKAEKMRSPPTMKSSGA